jgi:uncharacterized membrane protein YtjA (UPF0391 family)
MMLLFGLTFLVIALVGFVGLAVTAAGVFKLVLFVLLVTGLIFFILRMWNTEKPRKPRAATR